MIINNAHPPKIRPIHDIATIEAFFPTVRTPTEHVYCIHCGYRISWAMIPLAEDGLMYCPVINCDGTFIDLMPADPDRTPDYPLALPDDLVWSLPLPRLTDADIEAMHKHRSQHQAEIGTRPKMSNKEVAFTLNWLRNQGRHTRDTTRTHKHSTKPTAPTRPLHALIKKKHAPPIPDPDSPR